jgi:hypothetical protein
MSYQSHHCSATLLCSTCISVSLLASAALSVLLSDMHLCSLLLLCFMLCVFFPFYAPCLFCALHLLHTTCFYPHESHSTTTPISSLFYIFILSVHLLHTSCHASSLRHSSPYRSFTSSHPLDCMATQLHTFTSLFCMYFSHRVIYLIIIQTLHLLWSVIQGSLASLPVILRILCFSVSHNSSSSLVVTVSRFGLLWLLSPFLLMTVGCDLGPITSGLRVLGHLS